MDTRKTLFAVISIIGLCLVLAAQAYGGGPSSKVHDQITHQGNMPQRPINRPETREFNSTFNKHEQYEADMSEWRAQGRELRQKYNDPQGFGRNPTGFSPAERRYIESIGSSNKPLNLK